MDEKLDYLIRTFTYKRGGLEIELKNESEIHEALILSAKIQTLNEVLTVIYSLLNGDNTNGSDKD